MKKHHKILNVIFLILLAFLILISILLFAYYELCNIFKLPFKGNKYGEMVRQVQLIGCGVIPTIPIRKKIYYQKELVGVISNNILILKGTSTLLDTLKDLKEEKKHINGGMVASGANSIFEGIKSQLINENINYITGYSLGSMVGIQVALWIFNTTGKKTKNIFFGLPPITNEVYKNTFNKHLYENTVSYNNDKDPLAYPFFGNNFIYKFLSHSMNYHHVGQIKSDYPYTNFYKKYWFFPPAYHTSYF